MVQKAIKENLIGLGCEGSTILKSSKSCQCQICVETVLMYDTSNFVSDALSGSIQGFVVTCTLCIHSKLIICTSAAHVWQIGNCVGANNHQHFLLFLVFTAASSFYVLMMTLFASLQVWPKLVKFHTGKLPRLHVGSGFHSVGDTLNSLFLTTEIVASLRAFALLYLVIAALALLIGVGLLLQQQLQLLHSGQTFIDSLASEGWKSGGQKEGKSWANLRKLFGKTHPSLWLLPRINSRCETPPKKIHIR